MTDEASREVPEMDVSYLREIADELSGLIRSNVRDIADRLEKMSAENRTLEEANRFKARPEWRPIDSAPKDGTPILVGVSYRYMPYKPEGRRQMKSPGRWQRATEYGWENAPAPEQWLASALKPENEKK